MSTLLLRADAGPDVGAGHLMRCLAIAQAWRDRGGGCVMVTAPTARPLLDRLRREGVRVRLLEQEAGGPEDAATVAALAAELQAAWVVVDGYHFGASYQRSLERAGLRLLWIDDEGHAGEYCADLILNQNLHAEESLYARRQPGCELLLGPRFALLRREFRASPARPRSFPARAANLVITLGGADPANQTARILSGVGALERSALHTRVVAGPVNPHTASLRSMASGQAGSVELLSDVEQMPELLSWADLAISAAGSTCWELMFLGVPSLLVALADHQVRAGTLLERAGAASYLGAAAAVPPEEIAAALLELIDSPERRRELSRRGRGIVDGGGVARVLMRLRDERLRLREAAADDRELLWRWANDPEVRKWSFSSQPILWETHVEWFDARHNDPGCRLWLALDHDDDPVGQVRFDDQGDGEAEISVSVAAGARGRGLGTELILTAVRSLFQTAPFDTVNAYLRPDNRASVQAFEKAAFRRVGDRTVRGQRALHYRRLAQSENHDAAV